VSESLLASLGRYVPEVIVILTMMFLLYLESTYSKGEKDKGFMYVSGAIGLVVAFFLLLFGLGNDPTAIFTNAVVIDPFSSLIKMIMILGAIGTLWLCRQSSDIYADMKGEFLIMSVGILAGGMLLASANNFLTVYLGIETLSILSYVMASFKKMDGKSSEAGMKYVLYGGIVSGIMLFGMSHIFGLLGTIQFSEIVTQLSSLSSVQTGILIVAFVLFFAGVGYKIACVPFHMWSPDVYEGSPLPVTTFFAIVPKMAGLAVLVRVSLVFFQQEGLLQDSWLGLLTVIAALTMTVGNISAIDQLSVKRMLAYSSIAHAGTMVAGITVLNELGTRALLYYGFAYVFMTLVAFYITNFINDKYKNDHFERFSGLIYKHPFMAIALMTSMFSLAGLPPLSGFVAKFNIISAIVSSGNYTLAVITGLNSVISLYYYLRLVRLCVFKQVENEQKVEGFGFLNQLVIVGLTVPIISLGIFWEFLIEVAQGAIVFIK
jgi:NADH-quinone oxidoreductase subunit N